MNRMIVTVAAAAALASAGLTATAASAQSNRAVGRYFDPSRGEAPPVVIRKQLPFTDSGTAAPSGYDDEYFVDQTRTYLPVYSSFRPDSFGQDVLPGRFGEIGRGAY